MGCGHEITAFFTADTCAGMLDRIVFFCDIIDRACPEAVFVEAACSRKGERILPIECGFYLSSSSLWVVFFLPQFPKSQAFGVDPM